MSKKHLIFGFAAAALLLLLRNLAFADAGHVGYGTRDPNRNCNNPRLPPPEDTLLSDREEAVFAIKVKRNGDWQLNGTATLIDDAGIFITADHVIIYPNTKQPIEITQKLGSSERKFDAEVLWAANDYKTEDFAILRAQGWKNELRFPYPLRFDDIGRNAATLSDSKKIRRDRYIGMSLTIKPTPLMEEIRRNGLWTVKRRSVV